MSEHDQFMGRVFLLEGHFMGVLSTSDNKLQRSYYWGVTDALKIMELHFNGNSKEAQKRLDELIELSYADEWDEKC